MPTYYQVSVLAEHLSVGLKEQVQIRLPKRCPCCAGDVSPDEYLPEISFARPDMMGSSHYTVYRWRFPCCAQCARHIKVAQHPPGSDLGFLLLGLGFMLLLPFGLILLYVENENTIFDLILRSRILPWRYLIGLPGYLPILLVISIVVASVAVGVILLRVGTQRSKKHADEAIKQAMTDNCCSPAEPVRYVDVRESGDLAYKRDSKGADFIVGPDGVVVAAESPRPHDLHDNDTPRCRNMHVFEFRNRMYAEFFAEANGVQMREVTEPAKVGHIALGKAC